MWGACKRNYGNANIASQGGNTLMSKSGTDSIAALSAVVQSNPGVFSPPANTGDNGLPDLQAREDISKWSAYTARIQKEMAEKSEMEKWSKYTAYVDKKLLSQVMKDFAAQVLPATTVAMPDVGALMQASKDVNARTSSPTVQQ